MNQPLPPRIREVDQPGTARSRAGHLLKGGLVALGLAALVVLFFFNPLQHGFYPFCMLYKTTGLQCPGCGSLRALHELLHGHWAEALRLNPLLVLSLPLALLWVLRAAWRRVARRDAHRPGNVPGAWIWAGMTVLLVYGVVRNLPFFQQALAEF